VGEDGPKDIQAGDAKDFKRICKLILERLGYRVVEDRVDVSRPGPVALDFLLSGPEGSIVTLCAAYRATTFHGLAKRVTYTIGPDGKFIAPFQERAISVSVVKQLQLSIAAHKAQGGMIITSGRFSGPAIEYAEAVSSLGTQVQLIDRGVLAEMAAQVGIELTDNGQPLVWTYGISDATRLKQALGSYLDGLYDSSPRLPSSLLDVSDREVSLRPSLKITYDVEAAVRGRSRDGVLDRISIKDGTLFLDGQNGTKLDAHRTSFFASFEPVPYSVKNFRELHPRWLHFELDATGIAAKAREAIASHHAKSGTWWGNRGNLYYGTWKPSKRNVTLKDVTQLYLPENRARFHILETAYRLEFLEHPSGRVQPLGEALNRCGICGLSIRRRRLLCNICGKVAHRRKHGFKCKSCGRTMCRECVKFKKGILWRVPICPTCDSKP